jgi:hypothetical protein
LVGYSCRQQPTSFRSTAERARLDHLSPEQDGDERCDVFRAGLVLYPQIGGTDIEVGDAVGAGVTQCPAHIADQSEYNRYR